MDRFDFLQCNMIGNRHEICGETEPKEEVCMQFEKKDYLHNTLSPKITGAPLYLPFYYSPESRGRRRCPSNSRPPAPVSQSLPGTQNLLNKQQFATQNYLTLFRALLPPLLPLIRRTADKCFFPACSFNICHPKSGVGRRSREVCLSRRRRTG